MLPCPSRRGPGCPTLSGRDIGRSTGKQRCSPGQAHQEVSRQEGSVQGFMSSVEIQGVSQLTAVSKLCNLMKILSD